MNKHAYRIIFSQARGIFIAVAEIVKSRCKATGQTNGRTLLALQQQISPKLYKKINPLNFAVLTLLGATIYTVPLVSVVHAQIVADQNAPKSQQPTILNSGNGKLQVNIQTPSAGGISRNTYSQFDVGEKGAILNNSRNNTQTQIGRWVQGNSWLSKGEAKVILNEVNSANPSQLRGYIEVAGKQAQVVIANPSGLVCDGCGVINADRFTLTTGEAVMNQGYLESFRVREGQVTIAGKGLNGSLTPYTDIYSRALVLNTGLYANKLNTVLGVNDIQFQASNTNAAPVFKAAQANTASKAQFSLDIGEMGGMYAGKIFLVGNEHGLGMRNAGSINSSTEKLVLTSSGDLINTGNVIANKDQVEIKAQNIQNSGNISSATSQVTIQSQNLDNTGLISSADELHLQNNNTLKNSGKFNAARIVLDSDSLKNTGSIEQTGLQALEIQARKMTNLGGKIGVVSTAESGSGNGGTSSGTGESASTLKPVIPVDPSKDGGSIAVIDANNKPVKIYDAGYIHAKQNFANDDGKVSANGGIDLVSDIRLNNEGGQLALGKLTVKGESFNNNVGKLTVKQGDIDVKKIENKQGLLQSQSTLNINSQSVDNQSGKINTADDLTLNVAANLNNQQGKIYAAKLANVKSQSEINNSQGLIAAQQQLTVSAASVNNNAGQIGSVQQGITLNTTQGQLTNQAGKIQSAESILLNLKGLDNSQNGLISTSKDVNSHIVIDTSQQMLSNQNGQINSAGALSIQSGSVLNQQGLMSSQGDLSIESNAQIVNTQTNSSIEQKDSNQGILAVGNINLQAQHIDNSSGLILTNKNIELQQQELNNSSGGLISSAEKINIHGVSAGNKVINQNGQIIANKVVDIDLGLNRSELDNRQSGLILAGDTLNIQSQMVKNEETITGASAGLQSKNIYITASDLENTKGQIKSQDQLEIHLNQSLNNTEGLVSSLNQLNLVDDQAERKLAINNKSGTLIAGDQDLNGSRLNIITKSLTGDGRVLSHGDLNLNMTDDYIHNKDAQLQAQNDLSMSSAGKVKNLGELKSNGALTLKADTIENASDAEIESQKTQLIANKNVQNEGLINGAKTYLQAENIENNAGRIYGDHLAIQANSLTNNAKGGIAPVIASRVDLDLGINILNNNANALNSQDGSQIIALGDIRVGSGLDEAFRATGQAKHVNNLSSVINANGSITLNADEVNNKNIYFTTKKESKKESLNYWNMDIANPSSGGYNPGPQFVLTSESYYKNPESFRNLQAYGQGYYKFPNATMAQFMSMPEGYFFIVSDLKDSSRGNMQKGYIILNGQLYSTDRYQNYVTTKTTYTEVVDKSAPAKISAGHNLSFNGVINNDRSQIMVGGELKGDAKAIRNADAKGSLFIHEEGIMTPSVGAYDKKKKHDNIWAKPSQAYNPADIRHEVDLYIYEDPTKVTPVTVQDQSQQLVNKGIDISASDVSAQGNQTKQVDGQQTLIQTDGFEIRTTASKVKLPNNALFKIQPESKAGYLVETDSKFTNYGQWLSSGYMLSALGIEPAQQQKRLGDGYYEQRLIQDQIAQLTGRRYLNGYANDDEQYKALMNNGLTFAQQLNLRPGIALTAAQVSQLSSDIVWLVEKNVTLADGSVEKVLVPQVYVKARVGDLTGDGTLISADRINVKLSADLDNQGTIAGRKIMNIDSQNINNIAGSLQGGIVALNTEKDLNNIGGIIQADQAMSLQVKGDLNIHSTSQSTSNQDGVSNYSWTGLDRVAGLYVGKTGDAQATDTTMLVNVGGNVDLKAANITNAGLGKSNIHSDGDIKIGTVYTERSNNVIKDSKQFHKDTLGQDVGSQIQTVGDLILNANNIGVNGSSIASADGTTAVIGKENVEITEGRRHVGLENQSELVKKGTLSTSTINSFSSDTANLAMDSNVEGKKVIIDANNVDIRGSDIVSDDLTQIQAKENVSITAAENQTSNQSKNVVKKSGFSTSLSDGVASVGYGKSSSNTKSDEQTKTLSQSVVASKNGDVTIIAGKDLTTQAAILNSGKDLNLQGATVNLNAGEETNDLHTEQQSKNSGVSVGVTYSSVAAAKSAYDKNIGNNQFSKSAVGQVISQGYAVAKAGMAAQTPIVLTASSQKSDQTSHYTNSQAVVTAASAKGNLNIIATDGNINSQGALLAAEGDALLHAKDTINLSFATDHQDQTASNQTKGFSIDNRDWSALAGSYNNKNNGQAQLDKVTGTQLSVGGKTTLQTERGDINILGSSVAGQGDVNIHAARDVNIKSTQNSQSQSESSSNKGIGSAQISDTEKFYGYMNGKNQSNSQSVEQQRSQVGSLGGSVNIVAGNNYNQQVADVVANKDVNITAKQIKVLDDHNTSSSTQSSKDLKVGQFSRVSSPILDLIGAVDNAVSGEADNRTKALQVMASGTANYLNYKDLKDGAVLLKAESGIGFSTSKNQQENSAVISQQNNIAAGGNVNLTSTEGDIHLQNTQLKAQESINLDSAQHIVLESGRSQEKAEGKNSNAGASIGVGASVGAQTGAYVYGEADVGKGSNQSNSTTYNQTTLKSDRLNIKSKGDTTLTGAKATANRIDADVGGKLLIESQQDQVNQDIKQSSAGGRVQVSLGSAWEASGNLNQSKANGYFNGVNEQSGLAAGDAGFNIKVKDNTHLNGAYISSTASKDKNQLTTGSLTESNIKNEMSASANSQGITLSSDMVNGSKYGAVKGGIRNAVDQASNSQSDSSTTYSVISPAHINITNTEQQFALTGQTVSETVQNIRTNTDDMHRNIKKENVSELLKSAEQDRSNKMLIYSTAELFTDEAHKTMFTEKAKGYEVERDKNGKLILQADGKTPKFRKLAAEELAQLKKSPDGTVHVAVNGIFNDQDAAAKYAVQNDKGGEDQGRYFLYFPKTNNFISELLVAGYQKNMENDFWGLTNSSQQLKAIIDKEGRNGLTLTGHSRGTMTVDNTMQSLLADKSQAQYAELYVNMVGAAANVNLADQKLAKLQGRENMTIEQKLSHEIQYQGNKADAVSGIIGGNTPTGGENLAWYMKPVRWGQMFGPASVHSCYGSSSLACQDKPHWSDSENKIPVWYPASQSQLPLSNRIVNSFSEADNK